MSFNSALNEEDGDINFNEFWNYYIVLKATGKSPLVCFVCSVLNSKTVTMSVYIINLKMHHALCS